MFISYNVRVYTSNLPASTMSSYVPSKMRRVMTSSKVVCLQWIPKKPASNLPLLLIVPQVVAHAVSLYSLLGTIQPLYITDII